MDANGSGGVAIDFGTQETVVQGNHIGVGGDALTATLAGTGAS